MPWLDWADLLGGLLIGFIVGGKFALRKARSGAFLVSHRVGLVTPPAPPQTARDAAALLKGMPRSAMVTLMLAIAATLTEAEMQEMRARAGYHEPELNDDLLDAHHAATSPETIPLDDPEPVAEARAPVIASAARRLRGRRIDLT